MYGSEKKTTNLIYWNEFLYKASSAFVPWLSIRASIRDGDSNQWDTNIMPGSLCLILYSGPKESKCKLIKGEDR